MFEVGEDRLVGRRGRGAAVVLPYEVRRHVDALVEAAGRLGDQKPENQHLCAGLRDAEADELAV
jgi:hypothetical protein